ncbi:MAG: DUF3256 family protein [Bacteroidaceae bacterium]|nr:DUF3256 family protein [Bacteroidaceae bacterium]
MIRLLVSFIVFFGFCCNTSAQQIKMRDVFANTPDSIFPLLTKNNKLDCIDFIENNMRARIKNKFDTYSELTALTADYLRLQISEKSSVEMKIFNDSLLCLVRTYYGPAADSEVFFYNVSWQPVSYTVERPKADEFFQPGADAEVCGMLRQLPLIKASLSPDDTTLTWEIQTTELTKAQRETVKNSLSAIAVKL